MDTAFVLPELTGWSVICLRPAMQQAAARRAVQARGARHVSLPGLALVPPPDVAQAREDLRKALDCPVLVFTSPAAVVFAARLLPLKTRAAQVFAVGEGTRRALARQGLAALAPSDDAMHSEGLMAMPHWHTIQGPVGLVTAPGGRGVIAARLAQRELKVQRAECYQRRPPRLDGRHWRALAQADAPRAVLVSSGEALEAVLAAVPEDVRGTLLDSVAVASSPRLARMTAGAGFAHSLTAPAPTVPAMLDALAEYAAAPGFR